MAHTNETTNYNLPQFVGSDKPAWLTDVNQAFAAIDAGMGANRTAAQQANTAAASAQDTANAASSAASTAGSTASAAQLTANQVAADLVGIQTRVQTLENAGYISSSFEDIDGWKVKRDSDGTIHAFKTVEFGSTGATNIAGGIFAAIKDISIPAAIGFAQVFAVNTPIHWGTGYYWSNVRSALSPTQVSINCFKISATAETLTAYIEIIGTSRAA